MQNKMELFFSPPECLPIVNGVPVIPPESRQTVEVKEPFGSRKLYVPRRQPVEVPILFNKKEYERLQKQAHVVTLKDRQALIDEAAKKKVQMEEESHMRKGLLEKYKQDQTMKPGANLTEVRKL